MDVVYRGNQVDVVKLLTEELPSMLGSDDAGIGDALLHFYYRIANTFLSLIQRDFATKSRGGTGLDGIKWKPLKPETIAARRVAKGELRKLGFGGKRERGLLTPAQNQRWKKIFAGVMKRLQFQGDVSEGAAKAQAARIAWATVKREGAKTKLEVLGSRIVDILRDEGLLFRSFTPGVDAELSHEDGQIVRRIPRGVIVGTNQKSWHHAGVPGRLPARPFWPQDGSIPPAWWPEIARSVGNGLLKLVKEVVTIRSGRKVA